jgi:hypothetical protein
MVKTVMRWRPRWYELAPEAVLVLGLTLFAITEPRAAISGLKSSKAIVLMFVVTVVWVAARILLWRLSSKRLLTMVPFAIGALAILKIVVLPAYSDTTVVETLGIAPIVATTAAPGTAAPGTTAPTTTGPAPTTTIVTPTTADPAAPVLVRTSSFRGIDHRASGTVNIYRQPDGSYIVGLEGIDIQPGPDYDVYVVPGADKDDRSGGTRLDDLRGNKGTQFYEVMGPMLEDGAWTVLVWCDTFAVPVAAATPV